MKEKLFFIGVKSVITNDQGEVLLLRAAGEDGEKYWDLPGGRINADETELETLHRETREETGVALIGEKYIGSAISKHEITVDNFGLSKAGLMLRVWGARVKSGQEEVELSDEHVGCEWVSRQEAKDRLSSNYPTEICHAIDGESVEADHFVLTTDNNAKLVRDKIPEIIRQQGEEPRVETLSSTELEQFVNQKISEEAKELSEAKTDADVLEEAADLIEILRKKLAIRSLSLEDVEVVRQQKLEKRGGFDEGYLLYGKSRP